MRMERRFPYFAAAIACGITPVVVAARGGDGINTSTDRDTVADQRAAALVAQMTTDEKIQMVHGSGFPPLGIGGPFPAEVNGIGYIPGIPRLGTPHQPTASPRRAPTG